MLVIMVKEPAAGRVKTRLARDIGLGLATGFYRHAVASLVARLTIPRRWSLVLAVSPGAARQTPALPSRARGRVPQGRGDLGERMQRVFDRAPAGPVIVIGSDVPGITERDIASAFRSLQGHAAVIGPSPDGGYWLVGLRRCPRCLRPFRNVRWSTDDAFAGTMRNLAGSRVAILGQKADIDDAADWSQAGPFRTRRTIAPVPRAG